MTRHLLGHGKTTQQPVGFTGADLHLEVALLDAGQAFLQAAGNAEGAAAHLGRLAAQLVDQIVGATAACGHQGKQVGAGDGDQAKAGIEAAAHPLEGGEGPHHEDQLRGQAKGLAIHQVVEIPRQLGQHVGIERGRERIGEHHPHQPPHRARIDARGDHASRLQLGHQAAGIAGGGGGDHPTQAAAQPLGDLAHHAEVVVNQGPIAGHGQVSRVGIGVEKAEAHELLQITGRPLFRHGRRVDAGLDQGLAVGDLDARHVIEAEHPPGGELPHHPGDADAAVLEELLAEPGRMFGFQAEIQLPQQHPPAFLGDRHPVAALAPAGMALQQGCDLLQHLQVEPEQALQAWPLDLEHHLATAAQAGAVHLGQAGGPEGALLQVHHLNAAFTQLLLQQLLGHGKGESGHLVLQPGQFLHVAGRQHIRPGREELPELDEGRSQAQQLSGEPMGPPLLAGSPALRGNTAAVGPIGAIGPEAGQQAQHRQPDA